MPNGPCRPRFLTEGPVKAEEPPRSSNSEKEETNLSTTVAGPSGQSRPPTIVTDTYLLSQSRSRSFVFIPERLDGRDMLHVVHTHAHIYTGGFLVAIDNFRSLRSTDLGGLTTELPQWVD